MRTRPAHGAIGVAAIVVLSGVAVVLLQGSAPPAPLPRTATPARVVQIVDGDTIRVVLPTGAEETVRLIGIDAPEAGEPLAVEATAFLAALVDRDEVGLVRDVSDRDRFGRLLRYVHTEDAFVNEEMVRAGLAVPRRHPPDTAMAETLEGAVSPRSRR